MKRYDWAKGVDFTVLSFTYVSKLNDSICNVKTFELVLKIRWTV